MKRFLYSLSSLITIASCKKEIVQDRQEQYNWATFKQIIRLMTFIATILVALLFLIGSFIRIPSKKVLVA